MVEHPIERRRQIAGPIYVSAGLPPGASALTSESPPSAMRDDYPTTSRLYEARSRSGPLQRPYQTPLASLSSRG